ncbi:helix-turn-helix domain-containing protein [Sphingomonas pruni]|uniref:helix-turn-helix domain-containing protein n=1 Tax=Sphingomonas pruni TaxID=40683 RepID=UPI001FDF2937|nr:AraC family transcriptional regulator [Sphingomonas pruni]
MSREEGVAMQIKQRVEVSHEMLSFVGSGIVPMGGWPEGSVGMSFRLNDASLGFHAQPTGVEMIDSDLAFVVTAEACRRIFGFVPLDDARWHMPTDLRAIVIALVDCRLPGPARDTLRLAKSIELLCATFEKLAADDLVAADATGELKEVDARRIVAARRLIDERWNEKLTLDSIARACGLNRAKLTRGFRSMFDMTVADAIAEMRLGGASEMLRSTDLPVSSIGYRCGYLNNASFTRAFSRRYGVAPTRYRAHRLAA